LYFFGFTVEYQDIFWGRIHSELGRAKEEIFSYNFFVPTKNKMVSWFLNIQRSQETKTDYLRRLIEETEFQLKVRILRNRVLHGKTIHCSVKYVNSK
jgi:hypothetical protein